MSRYKKTPFKPWESTKFDGIEKRYIRLSDTQLMSTAMKKLKPLSFKIYIYMRIESAGRKDFKFPHGVYNKKLKICSKQGFQNALKDLQQNGFIEVKEHNKNLRIANVYSFSDKWKGVCF